MTKDEFAKKLNDYPMPGNARAHFLNMLEKLELDQPPPQPTLLPFIWPVPDGCKVVTRSCIAITEFGKYETTKESNCLYGVVNGTVESWYESGLYTNDGDDDYDLFLLPPAPEMVTLWVNYYRPDYAEVFATQTLADHFMSSGDRIGPAIKVIFPKPINIQP